ncbi:MAG: hypothetical protein ACK56I_32055, partial [bacterium]
MLRATDKRVIWNDIEVIRPTSCLRPLLVRTTASMRLLDCLITASASGPDSSVFFDVQVALKEKPPAVRTTFAPWRVKISVCRALLYR